MKIEKKIKSENILPLSTWRGGWGVRFVKFPK